MPSRRSLVCLAAAIAAVSCGRDAATALDLRLMLTGSIDQVEVRRLLVGGTALDLTGEQTRFPTTARTLSTGDVLTVWFADTAAGEMVTLEAVGLRCGVAVTDLATTSPRMLEKGKSTTVDLALEVNRTASCDDAGVDAMSGSGGRGGSAAGGRSGAAGTGGGGMTGTGGTGGAGGMTGVGGVTGPGGTGGVSGATGAGGITGAGGAAGRGGTTGVGGTTGAGGVTGAGGTTGAGGAAGRGGTTGVAGTSASAGAGGRGGTGVAGRGGTGGATKPNGTTCGGNGECTTGNCVDGVCCDTPQASCNGCRACNLTGSPGVCGNVPTGTDPHAVCPAAASNCAAGGCTAGACTPSANTVVCSSTCSGTNQRTTRLCNGVTTGCANAPSTAACPGNLTCANATSCNASCTTDAACVAGFYCSGGSCVPKLGNGQPCSAANQCTSGACTGFHRDADGDTYGVAATTTLCGSSPPAGYVVDATDCCDADMDVRPGQTTWFASGSAACGGTFDYNCVNGPELQYGTATGACTNAGGCTPSNPRECITTIGWSGTAPGCGGGGTFITGCNIQPAECTSTCADPGSCGRGCALAVTASRTQGCH